MKVYVGVGHGWTPGRKGKPPTYDRGAASGEFIEHDLAHRVCEVYVAALQRHSGFDVRVDPNSGSGHDPNEVGTAKAANAWPADLVPEVHLNASEGHTGHGIEVLIHPNTSARNRRLAENMARYVHEAIGLRNRGVKERSNLHFLKATSMPALIPEIAFLDHPEDQKLIRKPGFFRSVGEALARATCEFAGITYVPPPDPHPQRPSPICGLATIRALEAESWAEKRGATEEFTALAQLYWVLAGSRGGVRPEVAFAQSAKETGFGRFGGVIDATYRNPCGIKTRRGGPNSDPDAHQRFRSWPEGITAHLDHLALYAGSPDYPLSSEATPDPRHFAQLRGTALTVEELSGRWAGPGYGESVVKDYLNGLLETPARGDVLRGGEDLEGRRPQAGFLDLKGDGVEVTYSRGDDGGHLIYRGPAHATPSPGYEPLLDRSFSGMEIREAENEVGSLATVTLDAITDVRWVTMTLFVPDINLPVKTEDASGGSDAPEVSFSTYATFTTHHTSISGPDLVEGSLQTYEVIRLNGRACSPPQGLPEPSQLGEAAPGYP